MPCNTKITPSMKKLREETARKLEADLVAGKARLQRGAGGTVSVAGWTKTAAAEAGWCEGCVLRFIATHGGFRARTLLGTQGIGAAPFQTIGHGHKH